MLCPPDMMTHTMNRDGTPSKTLVVNDDGTVTFAKGGRVGVPPGAPEAFSKEREEIAKLFTDAAKKSTAQGSPAEAENKKPSKKDENSDFGKAFSKNLRGAFM